MPSRRTGILLLVALLGPLLVLVAPRPALAEELVAPLLAQAEADGTVRVQVQLDVDTVPEALLSSGSATRQRDRIDAAVADLVADLPDQPEVQALETHPTVAIDATPELLEALASADGVAGITAERILTPMLDSSVPIVQAGEATTAGYDGAGWNVAVLDTGVQSTHSFLAGRVVEQVCYSGGSDCPNGSSFDDGASAGEPCTYHSGCDHGTHVAGIAAGSQAAANAGPTQGVAPGAGIVAVQVFSEDTSPPINGPIAFGFDLNQALDWVVRNHAALRIASVNMSLGGSSTYAGDCDSVDPSMTSLITSLRTAGVATVISSGNGYQDAGMSWPGCLSPAISVGATTDADTVASYSNVSPTIDLLAPGSSIESSVPGSAFAWKNGTSMAAPHVAGAWAAARSASSAATVDAVLAALRTTGAPIDDTITQDIPRIRLGDALRVLHATASAPRTAVGVAGPGTVSLSWTAPRWAGASAITDYEVTASPAVTNPTRRTGSGSTTSLAFDGLADGVPYTFAITAVNGSGTGDVLSATFTPLSTPEAPTAVTAVPRNGKAIVSWTAPAVDGGGVSDYQVTASPAVATPTLSAGAATSLVFTGLTNDTPYTFTVTAGNAVGTSPASDPSTSVSPLLVEPDPPTGLVGTAGENTATVTWTAPADDGGSPITGYVVTPTPGTAQTVTDTTATFSGVDGGVPLSITVAAVSALGTSSASAAVVVTPLSPPPPPAPAPVVTDTGGGGGFGGFASPTTTSSTTSTTRPPTTTTTRPTPTTTVPPPTPSPGASVGNGDVITIRDGKAVVIERAAPTGADVVAGAATPSGDGAWSVTASGQVFKSGDAAGLGDLTGTTLNAPIVGIAPTPSGDGYWLLGEDGGIFSFGDAAFHGSTGNKVLNDPVVGMASTESGDGYWLFAGDGGIFTFGDARFFGSTGAMRLNAAVTTMAPTPTGRGYWLLGADGGVFTFGDARFQGSTGGRTDVGPIEAIVPTATGRGYWLIGNDSRLHRFGDAA